MNDPRTKAVIDEVTRKLIDEGKLMEAGFFIFQRAYFSGAPPAQIDDMKIAFLAGAQHLWGSVITMLEPGTEETEVDVGRMEKINDELASFVAWLKQQPMAGA